MRCVPRTILLTAEAAFREHPEMLLKRVDFAAFVVNWNDKVENLEAIARQLNIGIDSLVFVDDNPVERAFVRDRLPMVAVPELPADPAYYVRCIAEAGYFELVSFTQEDKERANQYSANSERENLRLAASDMEKFLRQLDMSVISGPITSLNVARATQLINKTNQFNTTTIRRTESELQMLASQPGSLLLQFRLMDRFGDHGLVSVMLLKQAEEESGCAGRDQLGDELSSVWPPARGRSDEYSCRGCSRARCAYIDGCVDSYGQKRSDQGFVRAAGFLEN